MPGAEMITAAVCIALLTGRTRPGKYLPRLLAVCCSSFLSLIIVLVLAERLLGPTTLPRHWLKLRHVQPAEGIYDVLNLPGHARGCLTIPITIVSKTMRKWHWSEIAIKYNT